MDTVQLEGKGFTPYVEAGQKIKQGDVLVDVDIDYIKSQGKSLVTPIVFTDGRDVELLKINEQVQAGAKNIIKFE